MACVPSDQTTPPGMTASLCPYPDDDVDSADEVDDVSAFAASANSEENRQTRIVRFILVSPLCFLVRVLCKFNPLNLQRATLTKS